MRITLVRAGLAALALLNLSWGSWAVLRPRHFFQTFPGFGFHWTASYPPFNDHLVTDLGATFLTLGVLLAIAAVSPHRAVRTVVLAGVLVFNALHLAFHALHRGELSGLDYRLSLASLVAGVLAPIVLLVVDRPVTAPVDR